MTEILWFQRHNLKTGYQHDGRADKTPFSSNPDTCPVSAGIAENSNGHWS